MLCTQVNIMFSYVTLSVYPHRAGWKVSLATVGIEPATFGILVQCSANWATRPSLFESVVEHYFYFSAVNSRLFANVGRLFSPPTLGNEGYSILVFPWFATSMSNMAGKCHLLELWWILLVYSTLSKLSKQIKRPSHININNYLLHNLLILTKRL